MQPASRCNKLATLQQTTTIAIGIVVQNMIATLTKNKNDAHIKPTHTTGDIYSHTCG